MIGRVLRDGRAAGKARAPTLINMVIDYYILNSLLKTHYCNNEYSN
jgi:hypothetical protein